MLLKLIYQAVKSLAISVYPVTLLLGVVLPNIKASIENYSKRWFEYPYPAATNVAGNEAEWNILFFCYLKEQIYGELQIMNLVTFGFL
jgi:hypothetical protein